MRFIFDVGPCTAVLVEGNRKLVDRLMRIRDPRAQDSVEFSMGLWDGLIHHFDKRRKTMPAGLLPRLTKRLIKRGHTVETNVFPKPPVLKPARADCLIGRTMDGDRAFQLDAVNLGLAHYRGIWALAVNAGKCLKRGSLIQMADGTRKKIENIKAGDDVVALDADGDLKFKTARVRATVANGVKPLLRVTVNGLSVHCTGNHPFLTRRGEWTHAENLEAGQLVAVPRQVPVFGDLDAPEHEVKLLAYMLADGGVTDKSTVNFTKASSVIVDDFRRCVAMFDNSKLSDFVADGITYSIVNSHSSKHFTNGAKNFIRKNMGHGLSKVKTIPKWVFRLTREKLAMFLKAFISCDGHVSRVALEIGLASKTMVKQLMSLLSRFGVCGAFRKKRTNLGTDAFIFYSHGRYSLDAFMSQIGTLNPLHHENYAIQAGASVYSKHDRLPLKNYDLSRRITSSVSRRLKRTRLNTDDSLITRGLASAYADVDSELSVYVNSDVTWCKVDSVVPVAPDETYDIEVEGYHNFIANGLIVHNTSVLAAFAGELKRQANIKTLVIVPNKNLVHQTGDEVAQLLGPSVKVGKVGDGLKETDCDIMVGTFQSLAKAVSDKNPGCGILKFMNACGAVVADEAHRATSASHQKILESTPRAMFRIACTGTLDGSDKSQGKHHAYNVKATAHRWELEGRFGPVLISKTGADLVEAGISAKPRIILIEDRRAYGPTVHTPKPVPGKPFMPQLVYQDVFKRAAIADKKFRRSVCRVASEFLAQGKPPFVFSHSVVQLNRLKKTFDKFGVKNVLLTGSAAMRVRREGIAKYAKSRDTVLLVSSIFDEGFSLNLVTGIVFAGARKTPREIVQRIGRGMRKKEDDNTITIVDFSMHHSTLLFKQFKSRCAEYEAQGYETEKVSDLMTFGSLQL